MKRVLFLGAAPNQAIAIQNAVDLGLFPITVDNRPENPGHKFAAKSYCDTSTLDKEAVLAIAKENKIDGIISFASDVSMPTAIYVSEQMGFPNHSNECVSILSNKHAFRKFMVKENLLKNFFFEEFFQSEKAQAFAEGLKSRFVVKPVDSSGSKGVSILEKPASGALRNAIELAFNFSISKRVIIEKYIQKTGPQICGDGYFEDGRIKFVHFGNGQFYEEVCAPYGEIFPSSHSPLSLAKTEELLNEVLCRIGFWKGAFNLDVIIDESGEPFIIELGPRSGGNFIPEAIRLRTNVDMTRSMVELAANPEHKLDISMCSINYPVITCYMVHGFKQMTFERMEIKEELKQHVLQVNPYIASGTTLDSFRNSSHVAANIIFKFDSLKRAQEIWAKIPELIHIHGVEL